MSRCLALSLGLLWSSLLAEPVAAQWNVARFPSEPNRVYATFGLDPALTPTVGYARVVGVRGHPLQVTMDAGVVAADMDLSDFRARLGVQTSLLRTGSLHLTGSATAITRGTENSVHRALNFGADLSGTVGMYRPRWFVAGEFGKDKAVITHVTHTEWYRKNVFGEVRDGWYLNAGGTYHYGAAGGVSLGRAELTGRVGGRTTERLNTVLPPVYASVGIGFSF